MALFTSSAPAAALVAVRELATSGAPRPTCPTAPRTSPRRLSSAPFLGVLGGEQPSRRVASSASVCVTSILFCRALLELAARDVQQLGGQLHRQLARLVSWREKTSSQ
jgi:hypothetical protein